MENYSQLVALSVIHTAREYGYLDGPLTVIEKLADLEKDLFIAILKQIKIHLQREQRTELSAEEIIADVEQFADGLLMGFALRKEE